ncbi:hypothetical protein M2137_001405 [Parabacteroides sp. PFB2-10]|nr:hypothetical protein [Parabacteroides sp. PFB2-10]
MIFFLQGANIDFFSFLQTNWRNYLLLTGFICKAVKNPDRQGVT